MKEKPLLVQSDRTILLDLHQEDSDRARSEIIPFTELIKSPEHMHTYQISALSIWNAVASGLTGEEMIERLKRWSRYELDERVTFFIRDISSRYGDIILEEGKDGELLLVCKKKKFFLQIEANKSLEKILVKRSEDTFALSREMRGNVKLMLIKMNLPVDDRVPLKKGEYVPFSLKPDFKVRKYQENAVKSLLGNGESGTGFGVIVLPCGSGKTIVGLKAMEALKTRTLILAPNVSSVHQWISEIRDKSTYDGKIGEYSGEKKEIEPITVSTYQILTYRNDEGEFPHFSLLRDGNWGFVIYDEVHMLPAPVFRLTAELQSLYRLGLTATLVREDGKEDEVFSLVGPKRFDTPWSELEKNGFIAKAYCHEIRITLPEEMEILYATSSKKEKYRIAAENYKKIDVVRMLLERHKDEKGLIIGQYLDQLKEIQKAFGFPIITGSTKNSVRDELYSAFRSGKIRTLIVSKVANYAIDLPDASLLIQVSGTFGSRQEEAQRLGRILRPKDRDSHFYTIVTELSEEENYALNRQKFLSEQGYSYTLEKI